MPKLLNIIDKIQSILIYYDEIYKNDPNYKPKFFMGRDIENFIHIFDEELDKKVYAELYIYVDKFVRDIAKKNGCSIDDEESEYQIYLNIDNSICKYDYFIDAITANLIGIMFFPNRRTWDDHHTYNHFEFLMCREYPIDGTPEERAECSIDYILRGYINPILKYGTNCLISSDSESNINDDINFFWLYRKKINPMKEVNESRQYDIEEENIEYEEYGTNDTERFYKDFLKESTLNFVLIHDHGIFAEKKDLYKDLLNRLNDVESEIIGTMDIPTKIIFDLEKHRIMEGMIKINAIKMVYYISPDMGKYRLLVGDLKLSEADNLFSKICEINKNIKEIEDFLPKVRKEYFFHANNAKQICLPLIEEYERLICPPIV